MLSRRTSLGLAFALLLTSACDRGSPRALDDATIAAPRSSIAASLRASFPRARVATTHRADVTLPARADGPTSIADAASGLRIEVRLEDATPAAAERDGELVIFRRGHRSGADVVHRVSTIGDEDFLSFDHAPEIESIAYAVELGEGVASLRQVGGTLEVLDAGGAPRLRMEPPYLIDAAGARLEAKVAIEGCAFDASPRAPWGRAAVAPGASSCTVHVDWAGRGARYPLLLDPTWTTTGALADGRANHVAVLFNDGRVLVAGGRGETNITSAELFDPASGTWTATGSASVVRESPSGTLLPDGRVLLAGGNSGGGPLDTAELYDPSSGTWTAAASTMSSTRASHAAALLASGKVLVAGGYTTDCCYDYPTATADLFDPATATFSPAASMTTPRFDVLGNVLPSGKVLVGGGIVDSMDAQSTTAEVYDPAADAWTAVGSLAFSRVNHASVTLLSGKVLYVGGSTSTSLNTAEVFDEATNMWTTTGPMSAGHRQPGVSLLSNGEALVTGGYDGNATELFDESANAWTTAPVLLESLEAHSQTTLLDGRVLVAGGEDPQNFSAPWTPACELFSLAVAQGSACGLSGDCVSGFCVSGVCCDSACDDGCSACTIAGGATEDGTCVAVEGLACDDGDGCTTKDSCQSGVCVGGAPLTCTASDACHQSTGCKAGQCLESAAPDGAPCGGGTCFAGACIGDPDAGPLVGSATSGSGGASSSGANQTTSDGSGGAGAGGSGGDANPNTNGSTATASGCATTDERGSDASALLMLMLGLAASRRGLRR